jgi:SAM-dependent methyltransferase
LTCLICGSTAIRDLYIQNGYRIVRCAACGFAFVSPTPTPAELASYYAHSYTVPLERDAGNPERHAARIDGLERWQPRRGRLLEVGASYGHSLAEARRRGWQVAGVELAPAAARYARERWGLAVFAADLLDAPFADASFDAAIMWHVLEHTHDPVAQLRRLYMLLRRGGVLGLRVPNAASFGARLAGRLWVWISPPAHLWYFSPTTLPRLLVRCGFEVLDVATSRGDGNNPYQHALIGLGGRLNDLRLRLITANRGSRIRNRLTDLAAPLQDDLRRETSDPNHPSPASPALRGAWLRLLARAQPFSDGLARLTQPLLEPLERRGWGDELVCFARRPIR